MSNFSSAADCASTLACLRGLGVAIRQEGEELVIEGGLASWRAPGTVLDAGNSGSTIRMLAGALAGRPFRATLTGDASLQRRPLERVAAPLRAMGASVETTGGSAPITITGGALRGFAHDLPVASAQVKTAILLAGLQADGRTTVREPMPSRDHTERMLGAFGVTVERDGLSASVVGGAPLRGTTVRVPGDASSAAFLVVAALVRPDSQVRLEGVLLSPTRSAFIDVLRAMGGRVETQLIETDPEPIGTIVASSSALRGVRVDPALVPSLIDEVPALAVAGAFASGELEITGAAELRLKESDRIAALASGLAALGASRARAAGRPRGHGRRAAARGERRLARRPPDRDGAGRGGARRLGADRDRARRVRGGLVPGVLRRCSPGPRAVPERPARVVLVGFMGAGKTTIGRRLARRLGYRFEDLDRRIEKREGRTIASLFAERGEAAFRALELEEARAVAALSGVVVATGGGAFAQEATRALLQQGAFTVWLQCSLASALHRVRPDGSRPLAGNREIMRTLLAEREPSYRMADVTVDTSRQTPRQVVDRIVELIESVRP